MLLTDTWRKANEATGRWRLCVLVSDSNEASRVAGCALADAQRREETGGGDSFLPVETKQVVARGWSHIKPEQGDDRGGR